MQTNLTQRQMSKIENFASAKLSETDKEMMENATTPSVIGESIFVSLAVEITDGENKAKQVIWDKVENINTPASDLSGLIRAINIASARYGYNYDAELTVTNKDGEEFYIVFKSGFFEAKAGVFLETVHATAGYLMQGMAGRLTKKALEKQIFKTANLLNLLAFVAVAEGKTKEQMTQIGYIYADKVQKLNFQTSNILQIESK